MLFDIVIWCAAMLLCAFAMASRSVISLDGGWELSISAKKRRYTVEVPRPWQTHSEELRHHTGAAAYRRRVTVPQSWRGKRVFIRFGAVDYFSEVFVNGQKLGEHEGGYTPFEFEAQDHLRFGNENEIEVRVVDPNPDKPAGGFRFEEIPHGKQSWYGNASGIWQSVCLEARSRSYIGRVRIDPDLDGSRAVVTVSLVDAAKGVVRLSIRPPRGAPTPAGGAIDLTSGTDLVTWTAEIPSPRPWSPDSPDLYEARVELVVDGRVQDSASSTFGMRKIEAREGKILLNNKPIFLAGALDQDFYPGTHYSPPSRAYVEDQFKKAKRLGLNMLRCHIKVPDPVYLDCADRLGLLVWYEIPNWMELTADAKRRAKETLTAMLERDHNRPCLVIVSIINEGWGIDLTNADNRNWLAEMYDYAKSLEPTRLVVDNSPCGKNFHVKSDIDDFHIYFQIPDLAPQYAEWIQNLASRPEFTFNRGPEGVRRGDEPLMLSEFGNWGLPRLDPLTDCEGGKPWWFVTGRRANTFPVGVEERFYAHGLDRVFGSFDGLADAFQWQEWRALKFQIEEMRKYASIAGYVVTEFTDLHWEPNGLLDFCRNPKVFTHLMPTIQAQDIVFVRASRANFTCGEKTSFELWLSHFSERKLSGAKLIWRVAGTELSGEVACNAGDAPFAQCIGEARFAMPEVKKPSLMRIELEMSDASGTRVAANYHEFTLFPVCAPTLPSNVIFRDKLDRSVLKEVCGGSCAVVCLERPDSVHVRSLGLEVVDRVEDGCWCNCLTWFKPGPAFAGAFVPKVMDFSFENLIPSSAIKHIKPEFWAEDVLGGIFVGWVDSNAAVIAQVRCGQGKAIITTLPLTRAAHSDPMARWLLASLARYVSSPKCAPALRIGEKR